MTKQELIAKIAKDTGSSRAKAAAAIDSLLDGITRSLKEGDSITLVGFGTFKTAKGKARVGRNPQTGATIRIPGRRVVRFRARKALKGGTRRRRAGSERPDPALRVIADLYSKL
ncbi:MAG: HU family DNA-binding protein [Vicinamibacterales bacterium]